MRDFYTRRIKRALSGTAVAILASAAGWANGIAINNTGANSQTCGVADSSWSVQGLNINQGVPRAAVNP